MLKISHLSVEFKTGTDKIQALDDINLEINDGDFITVIGSNGAGKSTIINAILGFVPYQTGSILLDNQNITNLPTYKRARDIGVVFQNPLKGTAPNLTIEENMILASHKAMNQKAIKNDISATLGNLSLGLENRLHSPVSVLSGGQRQALTLLMATRATPKLLLLDEHTAALDPKTAKVIMNLTVRIITEKKITTLMVTHNLEQALQFGNKLVLMEDGKIKRFIFGEEKKRLTIQDLIAFYGHHLTDRMVL